MIVTTVARDRVIPTNPRGQTTRTGRIGRDEVVFRVRPETFGERLARLARERGWSLKALARAADLPWSTVQGADTAGVSAYTVFTLADTLGVSPEYLFRGRG